MKKYSIHDRETGEPVGTLTGLDWGGLAITTEAFVELITEHPGVLNPDYVEGTPATVITLSREAMSSVFADVRDLKETKH